MEKKNLLDLNLQLFGEEGEVTDVEVSEAVEPMEETTEVESEETVENEGNDEPAEQSAEENARYAAIRRRAEEDAKRKYDSVINERNQQIAAMCKGVTHPTTGKPITTVDEYFDALRIQQRQAQEQELQDKGIDPSLIDKMIAQNPVVMQAQQVINRTMANEAEQRVQNDLAELMKIDPSIKGIQDLANLPNFNDMITLVERNGLSLVDAYKACNFDTFMQHTNDAARQQAINQMRGKSHLASQPSGVATENDDVEVPAEIMKSWKEEGKSEKQIRELYKKVAKQLHLN